MLASLRTSKTPVATARQVETIARKTAAELSATRRSAPAAALQPAPKPTAPTRPPLKASGDTTRTARREAARTASTFTSATAGNFSDGYVIDLARHASTSPTDREIAKAELTRRGITLHANGNTSRSTRKI
jgi:hypothetical protein